MTYTCCPAKAMTPPPLSRMFVSTNLTETESLVKLLRWGHGRRGNHRQPPAHRAAAERGGPGRDPGRDRGFAADRRPGQPDHRRDRAGGRGRPADHLPLVAVPGS